MSANGRAHLRPLGAIRATKYTDGTRSEPHPPIGACRTAVRTLRARIARDGHPLAGRGLPRALPRGPGRPTGRLDPAGEPGKADRARDGHEQDVWRRRGSSCRTTTTCTSTRPTSRPSRRTAARSRTTSRTACIARARHERYTLVARPRVRSSPTTATRRGEIRVAANVVDERGGRVPEAEPMPASSDTMVYARPSAEAAPDSARRAFLLVSTRGSRAGAVRPRRPAHRHRSRQRQRRHRRRPDGQPAPLPAQAPARRVRLHRPRQPQRLDRQRPAGEPRSRSVRATSSGSATPRSSSRCAS